MKHLQPFDVHRHILDNAVLAMTAAPVARAANAGVHVSLSHMNDWSLAATEREELCETMLQDAILADGEDAESFYQYLVCKKNRSLQRILMDAILGVGPQVKK